MRGNITVYLESGTYRLARPLRFGPRDSGTDGHDVIWAAAPGSTAVISGAVQVSGWALSDPTKGIWSAPVPAGLQTRQIYVDGMRATPASGSLPVTLLGTRTGYIASSDAMAHWRNPSEINFVYLQQLGLMTEAICPVRSIKGNVITMAQPCWGNSTRRVTDYVQFGGSTGTPSYAENAYELLTKPGQFYLDASAHRLYYIPRLGQDMKTADVEAPTLQTLIEGGGSAATPVHNLNFENLQFAYATWLRPSQPEGFSEVQSNYTITGSDGYATEGLCKLVRHGTCPYGAWTKEPGNVQFSDDRHISFVDDRFFHLGAAGLNLDNGSQDDTIADSVFTDISGNGIEIGNVDLPRAEPASQTRHIEVRDNHVYGVPAEFHGGVAILVGYAAGCTISHNQVDHTPYIGISLGWGGWLDKDAKPAVRNFSQDNVVSDNLVFDYMQVLSDGGGIYTQGLTGTSMANGEKVTGNVIHDQLDWGAGLKSDDGTTYVTYSHNVLWNNTYDWGTLHYDYRHGCRIPFDRRQTSSACTWDPLTVEDNWWQQGDATWVDKDFLEIGNQTITGPNQAPVAILRQAGIQPAVRSILSWHPPGAEVPSAPERVAVLYAFDGKAYVTWHPAYAYGSSPIVSYTVSACRAASIASCENATVSPFTISAGDFARLGYAVVDGLTDGQTYRFTVAAANAEGSGTSSVATLPVTLSAQVPSLPSAPTGLSIQQYGNTAMLWWYRPQNTGLLNLHVLRGSRPTPAPHLPVLSYLLKSSVGTTYDIDGPEELISTNTGGRVQVVVGLKPGRRYVFSVAAVDPQGTGPAATFAPVRGEVMRHEK